MSVRVALVAALIACALGIDLRIETAVHEITGAASSCSVSQTLNCDAVQTSIYAKLLGVSVSLWAAAGSALLAVLLLLVRRFGDPMLVLASLLAFVNGAVALVYLGIALFALGVNCLYCNGIQAASVLAAAFLCPVGLLAWRRNRAPAGTGRRACGAAVLAGCLALCFALVGEAYAKARVRVGQLRTDARGAQMRVDVDGALLLGDPVRGAENSYLLYIDFGCPKCRAHAKAAQLLVRDHPDRVHVFFKHWPLDRGCNKSIHHTVHENSCLAASAATVLARRGHAAGALRALFDLDARFTPRRLREIAGGFGVPDDEWEREIASREVAAVIARDLAEGDALGFDGVPHIYRNGRPERELRLPRR